MSEKNIISLFNMIFNLFFLLEDLHTSDKGGLPGDSSKGVSAIYHFVRSYF